MSEVQFKNQGEAMAFGDFMDRLRGIATQCEKMGVKKVTLDCDVVQFWKWEKLAGKIKCFGGALGKREFVFSMYGIIFEFKSI
jgi:hypothetical protein